MGDSLRKDQMAPGFVTKRIQMAGVRRQAKRIRENDCRMEILR